MVKQSFSWAKKHSSGDSLIEVLFAVAIFSAIAVSALVIMNKGLESAQSSLETTIARTEIDAQAEKIRFIADSLSSNPKIYRPLWDDMINDALDTSSGDYNDFIKKYKTNQNLESCSDSDGFLGGYKTKAFVIKNDNTIKRSVSTESTAIPSVDTGGLFIVAVQGPGITTPDYYDFYINACWNVPGNPFPTKLSTTIRIQNPDSLTAKATFPPAGLRSKKAKFISRQFESREKPPILKQSTILKI